jgi:hypothetical protein
MLHRPQITELSSFFIDMEKETGMKQKKTAHL